ncbi:MAG: serine/threonine-protein kinase [Thermoguttaceae bacterium]|jgi:serine/threonine-protein kinase
MNQDRHEQIKRIFLAACELAPGRIAAFLDEACAGDLALRQEVESLLVHHLPATIIGAPPLGMQRRVEPFAPGTVLAGRYRILGPLGRGGMGDVYRADDLKLDQPVALKFLSPDRARDPAWIGRYENEVRLARKVTHPNVLRVYDIVEADGEVFIAMEYVDGEDLAGLLRRVGRLTGEKVLEIARQLCGGLGAAHDRGVLHRDLKPANVMIDGRGQARIADFGIAVLSGKLEDGGRSPGTPPYMAPEVFQGGRPSVRSDLYSLGMVLYEMVSGREPFAGKPPTDPSREPTPPRLSEAVPNVDERLEGVILRCLEADPQRRPESAYAIAAVLPGSDPLRLALAAGETPSPSMVAAAVTGPLPRLRTAACCLATALAALFLVVLLADRTFLLPQAGLTKPPAVLADKAEHAIRALGYEPAIPRNRQGFVINREFLADAMASDPRGGTWKRLGNPRWQAVCFCYRSGGGTPWLPLLLGQPSEEEIAATEPPVITVELDGQGRLVRFATTPDQRQLADAAGGSVNWSVAFELAGLNVSDFQSVCKPSIDGRQRWAWEGQDREDAARPLRVEGECLAGRAVFFEVVPPWRQQAKAAAPDSWDWRSPRRMPFSRLILNLLGMIGGGLLAWRNLQQGRGDHRGARRLALCVFFLGLLDWLLGESHSTVLAEELASLYLWTARSLLTAATAWLCYFALEPYVRRFWPQTMITWSRVLRGSFRDPWVGRDILVGVACGILLVLLLEIDNLLPPWLGLSLPAPRLPPPAYGLAAVLGLRFKLSILVADLLASITLGLIVLVLMLLVRRVLRPTWLALGGAWLLLTAIQTISADCDVAFPWITGAIVTSIAMAVLLRGGLVALMAAAFTCSLLMASPITADFHAWYAPACELAVAIVGALLLWGFSAARAGRPLF